MKISLSLIFLAMSLHLFAQSSAHYTVSKGQLHTKGSITTTILPDPLGLKVQMDYDVKKKRLVPVPSKLLKGKTIMEFPEIFRTEKGYKELQKKGVLDSPKAELVFVRRGDLNHLKNAYFIEIKPKNKKSKIQVIYHPSLPSIGWAQVNLTFLSSIPVLDGYQLEAKLDSIP